MSREHRVQEGKVVFPLGVSVQGDVVVSVYHMRSTIGGRLQAKVIFMCFTLHFLLYEPASSEGSNNKPCLCADKNQKREKTICRNMTMEEESHWHEIKRQTVSGCGCN